MSRTWERIPEDVPYLDGERTIDFVIGEYDYSLTLRPLSPNKLLFADDKRTEDWIVEIVKTNGELLQLHGFAFCVPGAEYADCWFELEVGSVAKVTYWGDRTLLRTDKSKQA